MGLKRPLRTGQTELVFSPEEFLRRLAALTPPPRKNLTRYHGVFAPNNHCRSRLAPGRGGGGGDPEQWAEEPTVSEWRAKMTWAQRLQRVFGIDVEPCPSCGGPVRIIACIEDPDVI